MTSPTVIDPRHTSRLLVLAATALLAVSSAVRAADWLQFRGPNGAGKSDESVPTQWSATKNLVWQADLPGEGSSSPIVVGNRLYVTTYKGRGNDLVRHLVCFDKTSGSEFFSKEIPAANPEDEYTGFITEHGFATHTPVSDGERVYCFFGKSGVYAFDLAGELLWQENVGRESSNRRWGSAASPVLHGDHVIVNASEESQSVRALDKRTGEEVWKAEAASLELSYSTPLVVEDAEGKTEIVVSVPNELWGLHADTGKLKWYAENGIGGNVSPSLVTDGRVVYALGGRPAGAAAVRIGGSKDVTKSHTIWEGGPSSYVPSPVLHEGRLYWVDDNGTAICVNAADGEVVYRERLGVEGGRGGRPFYASVTYAGGLLYAVSRKGGTYVYKAQPQFELVAHNTLGDDRTDFNASPAVSDGRLYLRSNKAVYCIGNDSAGAAE
jgi:outer membrane protein assembly factor BamB